MNNLYEDSTYQEVIRGHLQAINDLQGSDNIFGKNYLDNDAPTINQANVTKYNDGHRAEIIDYYKSKMEEKEK